RGCPADRADIILAGAVVLLCLMRSLKINRVITSTRGLRYGLIES
ncbi:MAG: Ppx/GppA family phosphatase, partial [Planctomycetes bacterium]|nr:Ppx/GppA family phosphatase [Planctomycetota bacterium]